MFIVTDFQAPSLVDASGTSGVEAPSQFDVSSADRIIKSINSIERTWRLPQLPDEVKVDLASIPGAQPESIQDLLLGLDGDLNDEEDQTDEDPAAGISIDWDSNRSAWDKFVATANEWMGQLPPTRVTPDAIRQFKLDAIRRGRLARPVDGQLDSTWSPELNRIRKDMYYDDIDSLYAGNRSGAVPNHTVFEQLAKWTSPSGLLAAATKLDLFWDFGAIGREWSSWGDKWRKVGDSSGPIDFAKNLVDAATGPLDDIVLPAVNLFLLGSGVGAMANTARFAAAGARAAEAGGLMRSMYGAARLAVPTAIGETGMAEAGLLAKTFAKREVLAPIGNMMTAWRELPVVQRVKQGVQLGMRAGFLSQAEDLLPGYQGGASLSNIDQVDAARQRLSDFGIRSPLAVVPELMFAPQNIFTRGTIAGQNGIARQAARGFLAAGGTLPGRAAIGAVGGAAVGALTGDDVVEGMTYGALGAAVLPALANRLPRPLARAAVGGALGAGVGSLFGDERGAVGGALAGAGLGVGGLALEQAAQKTVHGVATVLDDIDPITSGAFSAVTGVSAVPAQSGWAHVPNPGKVVGWITDGLAHLDYRPISDDQRISNAFNNGIRRWLGDAPDELARWDDLFRQGGSFKKALQGYYGLDETSADAAMAFVTVSAMIDHQAALQSGARQGDAFLRIRTKLVNQLQIVDPDDPGLIQKMARVMAFESSENGQARTKRFKALLQQLTPETARREAVFHNQLAEATMRQLTSLNNVEDILDPTLDAFSGVQDAGRLGISQTLESLRGQSQAQRASALEAYVANTAGTFGDWDRFSKHTQTIDSWVNDGLLDEAVLDAVLNPATGAMRMPRAEIYKVDPELLKINEAITDMRLGDAKVAGRTRRSIDVLANSQPSGRFTMARKTFVPKQVWEEIQYRLHDTVRAYTRLKELRATGGLARVSAALGEGGFDAIDIHDLDKFLRANASTLGGARADRSRLLGLKNFMSRYGFSEADLDTALESQIEQFAASPFVGMGDQYVDSISGRARWAEHGFSEHILNDEGKAVYGIDALKIREKQVADKARRTAATVNQDALIDSVRASRGDEAADQLADQLARFDADGYKLVHGVEFLTPDQLMRSTLFRDLGSREMHAATFGNFFGRRQPAVARLAQERRERAVLADVLDVSTEDGKVTQAWRDLRMILDEIQEPVAEQLERRSTQTMAQKLSTSLTSSFTPVMLTDLTWQRKVVIPRLVEMGWSEHEAMQIFSGIRRFRNAEFKDLGLYALEAKVRRANLNVTALKWLRGETLFNARTLSMGVGGYAGAATGAAMTPEGQDPTSGQILGGIAGAVAGGLVGGAGTKAAQKLIGSESFLRAEQRAMWQLGDHAARWRDTLRFTLSPMFEVSRFTEGLMLGKTGAPLRNAAGERLALPTNMSPRSFVKRNGTEAWALARKEYNKLLRTSGRGDLDVADDLVTRFSQVGMFGFNPQHWQAAAYGEMRKAGIDAKTAFEHAVETYTYGIQGRSAAELSVNAVFFPFSFQKKALGHLAKWVQDDLGRSIIIHDALKTYEMLDEKYDLDTWFEDHVPALQQLRRLNVLAYGVSPGRFGGINAQLLETAGRGAIGLFMPMAFNVTNEDDKYEVEKLLRSLVPAWNDINWMIEETKNTTSLAQNGQLPRGQITDGFAEWNAYRQEVGQQLRDHGLTWADLYTNGAMADAKREYDAKYVEISTKYPEWVKTRREAIFNSQAIDMEKQDLLKLAQTNPGANSQADMLLAYESTIAEAKMYLSALGVSVDGPEGWRDAPPEAADALIERAVQMYRANPSFLRIWRKFYESDLGPIEARV